LDESALDLLGAFTSESVVAYELLLERAIEFVYDKPHEGMSADRLRAIVCRINAIIIRNGHATSERGVFATLVDETESDRSDAGLSNWDLFFTLRKYKVVAIETIEDLDFALAHLLPHKIAPIEIGMEDWLVLTR